jgi:hypothetical protein
LAVVISPRVVTSGIRCHILDSPTEGVVIVLPSSTSILLVLVTIVWSYSVIGKEPIILIFVEPEVLMLRLAIPSIEPIRSPWKNPGESTTCSGERAVAELRESGGVDGIDWIG